jgi:hypothetical protein
MMARGRLLTIGLLASALLGSLLISVPAEAAGGTATMRLAPAHTEVLIDSSLSLAVWVDTGGRDANAVQFSVALPPGLQCKGVTPASDVWDIMTLRQCDQTRATLAVGSHTPVGGKVLVGQIRLRAVEIGASVVEFTRDGTHVVAADTGEDILKRTRSATVAVSGLPPTADTAITAGAYHTCALADGDQLKCWGENSVGQLGDRTGIRLCWFPACRVLSVSPLAPITRAN